MHMTSEAPPHGDGWGGPLCDNRPAQPGVGQLGAIVFVSPPCARFFEAPLNQLLRFPPEGCNVLGISCGGCFEAPLNQLDPCRGTCKLAWDPNGGPPQGGSYTNGRLLGVARQSSSSLLSGL